MIGDAGWKLFDAVKLPSPATLMKFFAACSGLAWIKNSRMFLHITSTLSGHFMNCTQHFIELRSSTWNPPLRRWSLQLVSQLKNGTRSQRKTNRTKLDIWETGNHDPTDVHQVFRWDQGNDWNSNWHDWLLIRNSSFRSVSKGTTARAVWERKKWTRTW